MSHQLFLSDRFKHRFLAIVFTLTLGILYVVFTPHPIHAATCTFTGSVSADFNTAGNWNCGFVPGATSTAVIPSATTTALSAPVTVSGVLINTNATLTTTGYDLTSLGTVTSSGVLVTGSNTTTIGGDFDFRGGGTFVPGSGTIVFSSDWIGRIYASGDLTFNNFSVSTTAGSLTPTYTIFFTQGINVHVLGALTVKGALFQPDHTFFTVDGTVSIDTTASLFTGPRSFSMTMNGTTTNAGTIDSGYVGGGVLVFNGDFVNTGTLSTDALDGVFTINKGFTSSGTTDFSVAASSFIYSGSAPQTIQSGLIFWDLVSSSTGSTVTLGGNVTTTNDLSLAGGTLALGGHTLFLQGNLSVVNTFFDPGSGGGFVVNGSGSQDIGWPSATISPASLTIAKPSGAATLSGGSYVNLKTFTIQSGTVNAGANLLLALGTVAVQGGTLNGGSATFDFVESEALPFLITGGTFIPGTSSIEYDCGTCSVASTTHYNVSIASGTTASLSASTTILGTTTLDALSTLAVGANVLTAVGNIVNAGTITENAIGGGKIIHAAESSKITDSSGVEVSSISTPGTLYVTVQDSNRNLDGLTVETISVPVTTNSAAGSDGETMTLTETGPATGIFRGSYALISSSVVSIGNNQFEILANGLGTATYTDAQDDSDTSSDTATLTYVAAANSGGGGGGGLGSSGANALPPLVTTFQSSNQSLLDNLGKMGVAVHTLLKLPDDKNQATQEDSAVYYVGADGKRHAFPNDKVYFTWYQDFSGVQVINKDQLATIPLGMNITYKPGKKMVKFTTDPKVYAVDKGGILRHIASEQAATDLYGSTWNKMIDDINDAFYTNYTFGKDISGLSDFNPVTVEASVKYPSDSLEI